ncbi:MAG: hypothetical protein ISS77_00690 [Phycisphaerae bacterium]|nr:hypothetical protein [Phycisphaerae bacterium]
MEKQRREGLSASDSHGETKAESNLNQSHRIGAKGYGLDQRQQEAIADLWAWQEASLKSDIVLGGPIR